MRIIPNYDDPDIIFIRLDVLFHDDEKTPHSATEVTIFR